MRQYVPYLDWIDGQQQRMRQLVIDWVQINSGTYHLAGLEQLATAVVGELARLEGRLSRIDLPPQQLVDLDGQVRMQRLGRAIGVIKRPAAPVRVLLGIHLDTVYGPDDPFQKTTQLDSNHLRGPGVADAKGGLVVMLTALEALERSPYAANIGWEILLNPDEEIGSPGSAPLFAAAAARNHLGLLFEPAQEDGALVSARKGSGNFTAIVTGRSAHAGRNPQDGRNAIHALAAFVLQVRQLNQLFPGVTANVGRIEGGTVVNVVPDRALCRFNVRVRTAQQQQDVEQYLTSVVGTINGDDGIAVSLSGGFRAPPKPLDQPTQQLLDHLAECGRRLGLTLRWRESGGVSDGNRLAAAGLTNIDSLGVRGGAIHSPQEFVLLDSLTERAKLTALFLMRLAAGEIPWPTPYM